MINTYVTYFIVKYGRLNSKSEPPNPKPYVRKSSIYYQFGTVCPQAAAPKHPIHCPALVFPIPALEDLSSMGCSDLNPGKPRQVKT